MLTAVKLVDQWAALERRLPGDWETVALRLRTEQPDELAEAARILGPMNVGPRRRPARVHRPPRGRGGRARGGAAALRPARRRRGSGACSSRRASKSGSRGPSRRPRRAGGDARRRGMGRGARRAARPGGATSSACSSSTRARSSRAPRSSAPRSTRRVTASSSDSRSAARAARATASRPEMARRCFERLDDEAITGASRCSGSSPTPTTSPRRAPSGTSAARSSKALAAQLPADPLGERVDDPLRAASASSSVSVRSGAWKTRCTATDFRPSPTWSPW